eukprot:CAMPEP_0174727270 /NCGR_PEP_ID=MMETSP1094-20130205/49429_1 /TAXON_ID=156173 /ORGANISM="Chrysochromulina brevifilum, Strain UTEX LB 985" /LENGTH=374 /DNA_ID=CAMNT_0015928973 /DNA_START=98 /DNA_END=1222 /DNA_ORIENTATION=-
MDDLQSRIERQNQEVALQWQEYEARMAAKAERKARGVQGRGNPQQSEAQLLEKERELDRQLQLERSLARGASEDRRGSKAGATAAPTRRLTHANLAQQPEKENRSKISLLPPKTGASGYCPSARPPPSTAASVTPSERLRRPVHFTHAMAKDTQTQMDSFLNPVDGIRGQMKRAGIQPKNHLSEEKQRLAAMAAQRQVQAQVEAEQSEERERQKALLRDRAVSKAHSALDELGIGGRPSSRGASAGRRSTRPPATGSQPPPPPPKPHEPGRVPAYLQRRKAEWAAEANEEAARAAAEAECPPGLRLVGPEEKARILEKLAEERAKAMIELRQMPFVIKTNASQQKKDRLEARLEEIEGAEQAYAKEKVFVPADM